MNDKGGNIYNASSHLVEDWLEQEALSKPESLTNFDLNQNLLNVSKNFQIYSERIVGDGNKRLQFSDGTFENIFSNTVYWMEDVDFTLKELNRISQPGGRLCILVPNRRAAETNLSSKYRNHDFEKSFIDQLDGGRSMVLGKQAMTFNQWSDALGKSHWKIEECKSYICSDLLWHWDIGLRPMSSAFISHLARISEDERLIFKQEWIESLDELFQGFLNAQDVMEDESNTCWECIVCSKEQD